MLPYYIRKKKDLCVHFYWRDIRCLNVWEERRILSEFEEKVLRRIFRPMSEDVIGGCILT